MFLKSKLGGSAKLIYFRYQQRIGDTVKTYGV